MIFPNGVKVKADLAKRLEIIPSKESSDRKFVNESFDLFFSDKYIEKQIRNGCAKEQLLTQFRDSNRYETMKGEVFFSSIQKSNFYHRSYALNDPMIMIILYFYP